MCLLHVAIFIWLVFYWKWHCDHPSYRNVISPLNCFEANLFWMSLSLRLLFIDRQANWFEKYLKIFQFLIVRNFSQLFLHQEVRGDGSRFVSLKMEIWCLKKVQIWLKEWQKEITRVWLCFVLSYGHYLEFPLYVEIAIASLWYISLKLFFF